ncbi:MAG: ferrochelatase [Bdellovibrionales bacterium]|nr:ferrochelatase [Bdellovibrionales bacterium]
MSYDALLLLSFGGPEGPDDVMPFLNNVLRGKPVPEERKMEVASHYQAHGGISPINAQNRAMIAALRKAMSDQSMNLPIYWGNRNWKPYLKDTLAQIIKDGHKKILCYVTSAYSSYSGCRQYREDIAKALEELGDSSLQVDKIRSFFNHPLWIKVHQKRIMEKLQDIDPSIYPKLKILFTAHSLPLSMAQSCDYQIQLEDAAQEVSKGLPISQWQLCYQSRSGSPHVPWLGPDVCEAIDQIDSKEIQHVLVHPLGFVSDHMEVIFDLDQEAKDCAKKNELHFTRSKSPGTHPLMVELIVDLISEYLEPSHKRASIGALAPRDAHCSPDCCKPRRPS